MVITFGAPSIIKHYMIMATKNNYTQLVSVRLDNGTLAGLDELKKSMQYYSRSAIINRLLHCILNAADKKTLKEMVGYRKYYIESHKLKFEKDI